ASVISVPAGGLVANATSTFNPSTHFAAQLYVKSPATNVVINNITVDGQNNGINACDPGPIGIYFQNASGTVTRSAVVNEVLGEGLDGCQGGDGIFVQSGTSQVSTLTVNTTVVANYQKNGITGNEVGTTLTATQNTVVGRGPVTGAAE